MKAGSRPASLFDSIPGRFTQPGNPSTISLPSHPGLPAKRAIAEAGVVCQAHDPDFRANLGKNVRKPGNPHPIEKKNGETPKIALILTGQMLASL